MVHYTRGFKLGVALCEVFGLDPNTVKSLQLTLSADDVGMLMVEKFVSAPDDDKADRLAAEKGFYYLCAVQPPEPSSVQEVALELDTQAFG